MGPSREVLEEGCDRDTVQEERTAPAEHEGLRTADHTLRLLGAASLRCRTALGLAHPWKPESHRDRCRNRRGRVWRHSGSGSVGHDLATVVEHCKAREDGKAARTAVAAAGRILVDEAAAGHVEDARKLEGHNLDGNWNSTGERVHEHHAAVLVERDPDATAVEEGSCRRRVGPDREDRVGDTVAVVHTRTEAGGLKDIQDGRPMGTQHGRRGQQEHHRLSGVVGKGRCDVHTQCGSLGQLGEGVVEDRSCSRTS